MKTNATIKQLQIALSIVNKQYDNNISFETLQQISKTRISFTLKAISKLKGARVSTSGRNMPKASWHVHGHLFDALFSIDSNIYILSMGKKITSDNGNWIDLTIGGDYSKYPKMSQTSIEN